ncbi:MAG TPA: hypothetical protein ENN46_00400 [Candidatus Woesearchaeota archaeon]|nr:hypothetical protein [Candidatus Woesearchaeota archaeon]
MNKKELSILSLFQKSPERELPTSEIVKLVEPDYSKVENTLTSPIKNTELIKQAKQLNAKLHRKILYYLNKLSNEGILEISREGAKGEKYFVLAVNPEEISFASQVQKSSIYVPSKSLSVSLEGYEKQGIIFRLDENKWIERINSILLDASYFKKDLNKLRRFVDMCLPFVNDVISISKCEEFLEQADQVFLMLSKMHGKCSDHDKRLSFCVDISKINNEKALLELISESHKNNWENFTMVLEVNAKDIQEHSVLFERILEMYSNNNKIIYFKNNALTDVPYLVGKSGVYTFQEHEWKDVSDDLGNDLYGLACSQSTVMIDLERFFEKMGESEEVFIEFLQKIASSLLEVNSIQRRKSEELFTNLIKLDKEKIKHFFSLSKNYIRFWNYGWKKIDFNQDYLTELIRESKRQVDKFCIFEETIYKSCGMPTRFRIAFSSAFHNYIKDKFTAPTYIRVSVGGLNDLFSEKMKQIIYIKESLFRIFDGGDVMSFHCKGETKPAELLREVSFILNSCRINLFRLKFIGRKERNLNLQSYIK